MSPGQIWSDIILADKVFISTGNKVTIACFHGYYHILCDHCHRVKLTTRTDVPIIG